MSYGLETGGRVLGDLVGRGKSALQQGADDGAAGTALGAAGGATVGVVGVVTRPGELVIEPAAIGTGAALGGGIGALYGAGKGLLEGTPGYADRGAELGRWLSEKIEELTNAEKRAKARQKSVATTLDSACETCGCSQLAAGVPGAIYRGGAHAFMQEPGRVPPVQSHHMPPDAASALPSGLGPAIQMDVQDHSGTPSFGRNSRAPFMQSQRQLSTNGQFMTAFAIDAAAVEARFPGKYTAAIAQAFAYAQCLQRAGLIK